MSGKDMRILMEKIEQATLREGYEDRVQNVVDYLNKTYPDGMTKKQFTQVMDQQGEKLARELDAYELRRNKAAAIGSRGKTGDSRKEFIQDVARAMDFRRDTSKADAKRERVKKALEDLYWIAQDAIGMSFPDGDPIDHIIPKARRMGIPMNDIGEWLDRAFKKHEGVGYNEHLARLWDDQYRDAKADMDHVGQDDNYYQTTKSRYDQLGGDGGRNPWR